MKTSVQMVFILGIGLALSGCDLLGIGPKKKEETPKQSQPIAEAPATSIPSAPKSQGPVPNNALVRIGDWVLTDTEFKSRLNLLKQQLPEFKDTDANSKAAVLDELVRQQLLVKEAESSDIVNSQEIKDAIEDFRKTVLVQEMASRLTKDVAATEDEARTYYEANKDKFVEPINWTVSQIVAGDEATAKNILVQVLQGGDFAQIAQTQSKASNASKGGKLAPFASGRAPFEAMEKAISNLDAGGVSAVFKGPEGYYIVKVNAKKGGAAKSFVDIKKDLVYGLTMQKQQAAILNHLNELAEKNKPEYNKELIEQVIGKIQ